MERPRDLLGQEHNEKGCPEVFTLQDTPYERRRLPTLPHCIAVPSAPAGLTSLFGMGRGGTPPQMPPDVRFRKTARNYAPTPYGDSLGTDKKAAKTSYMTSERTATEERLGQLVALGFDVAVFTPAPYRRPSLGRPSWNPNLAEGFALRCFQRLSLPDAVTRPCTWRHNRLAGGLSVTVLSY